MRNITNCKAVSNKIDNQPTGFSYKVFSARDKNRQELGRFTSISFDSKENLLTFERGILKVHKSLASLRGRELSFEFNCSATPSFLVDKSFVIAQVVSVVTVEYLSGIYIVASKVAIEVKQEKR